MADALIPMGITGEEGAVVFNIAAFGGGDIQGEIQQAIAFVAA